MSEVVIRAALVQDVPSIETVIRDAYGRYVDRIGRPPAPMLADYGDLVRKGLVWIAVDFCVVLGLVILRTNPDHLLVSNVAVASVRQGTGVGSRLLAFAEEQAQIHGLRELRLFTQELMHENLSIYARLGWQEYDRAEQDGYQRVFLRKRLSDF